MGTVPRQGQLDRERHNVVGEAEGQLWCPLNSLSNSPLPQCYHRPGTASEGQSQATPASAFHADYRFHICLNLCGRQHERAISQESGRKAYGTSALGKEDTTACWRVSTCTCLP